MQYLDCLNCGHHNAVENQFCGMCGDRIRKPAAELVIATILELFDESEPPASSARKHHLPQMPIWTCPHCQHVHTPATLRRLDSVTLQCERCKRPFASVPDRARPGSAAEAS